MDTMDRLEKGLEFAKTISDEVKFLVNDIRSIDFLRQNGYKAINLDGIIDCINIVTFDDKLYLLTDEDTKFLKLQFSTAEDIK
jgi:ethanolamine utilization cobalamin adenosyltransferase